MGKPFHHIYNDEISRNMMKRFNNRFQKRMFESHFERKLKLKNVSNDIYNLFNTMRLNQHFEIEMAA